MRRKPVGQIQNHSREEPGFRAAEQKADGVKLPWSSNQGRQCRDDSPRDQHAADPDPRTYFVQNNVAWNFKQKISQEEDAGAESIDAVTELQVAHHLQLCKADVHPVDIRDDVEEKQIR